MTPSIPKIPGTTTKSVTGCTLTNRAISVSMPAHSHKIAITCNVLQTWARYCLVIIVPLAKMLLMLSSSGHSIKNKVDPKPNETNMISNTVPLNVYIFQMIPKNQNAKDIIPASIVNLSVIDIRYLFKNAVLFTVFTPSRYHPVRYTYCVLYIF